MSRIASTALVRSTTLVRLSYISPRVPIGKAILNSAAKPVPICTRSLSTSNEPPKPPQAEPGSSSNETGAGFDDSQASAGGARFEAGAKGGKWGLKISWIFGGLAGLGALVTIYGLLEFYSTLTTWPKAIRKHLRAALKSKLNGDYARSEKFFREAIDTTLEMGPSALESDPLLKITGIYVELSNVLEIMGQRVTAFHELRKALEMYGIEPIKRPNSVGAGEWVGERYQLGEKDHIRVIGLYQKLGQLALEISSSSKAPAFKDGLHPVELYSKSVVNWDQAAEYYLESALTAMLQLGLSSRPAATTSSSGSSSSDQQVVLGRDINLPDAPLEEDTDGGRVDKRGLGMTMESLSEVYARKKQYDLAAQLLLQAVSLLLPPQSRNTPPVRDRCQAAMLMTTISSHALRARTASPLPSSSNSTPTQAQAQAIKISKSWSLRSLQLSEQALKDGEAENYKDSPAEAALAICQRAKSVGLHNLGMLAEMEGDLPTALNMFNKALSAARETAFTEGKREAQAAIRRVQSIGGRASL